MLIPFKSQNLVVWGLALFAIGAFGFLLFILRFSSKRRRRRKGETVARRGFLFGTFELLVLLLFMASGLFSFALAGLQQTYRAFTERQQILQVRAFYVDTASKQMQVTLTWPNRNASRQRREFLIQGDQWEIEGNILTWDDFLTVYGFKPGYKLTRLRGRYLNPESEMKFKPTVETLSDELLDLRWRWILRYAPRLPGVRSAYGQTVFTYPDPNKIFELKISHDGFSLQERKFVPE